MENEADLVGERDDVEVSEADGRTDLDAVHAGAVAAAEVFEHVMLAVAEDARVLPRDHVRC